MRQQIAFDRSSVRTKDSNGFLHVAKSNLTRAEVADYYGREIPGYELLGLDAAAIYGVYRPAEELKSAANTFNGITVLIRHEADSAFDPKKALRVGATGTNAEFDGEYLTNALSFHDATAISLIESEEQKELSAGYTYEPVLEEGEFKGKKYTVKMTNIKGNHVALVTAGRAGPTVVVADSKGDKMKKGNNEATLWAKFKKLVMDSDLEEGAVVQDSVKEQLKSLIREIAGEHAEEGDTMAEIERLIEQLSTAQDSDPVEPKEVTGEDGQEKIAGDSCKPVTGDAKTVAKMTMDIDRIKADIYKKVKSEVEESARAKERALTKVRPLVGILDSLAFDSADEIYKYALDKKGFKCDSYSPLAFEGMVDAMASTMAFGIAQKAAEKPSADFVYDEQLTINGKTIDISNIRIR